MEQVSAEALTKRIVNHYFTKLDQDTQQDMFHYIRNFIVDEQEKRMVYKLENNDDTNVMDSDSADSNADSEGSDDESIDTDVNETNEQVFTPYDVAEVDLIGVYLHVRALYEETIKTPGFVGFWSFYHDVIP